MDNKAGEEENSRLDGHIMVEDCGGSVLAIEVEVGVLGQVEGGGAMGAALHADAQLIAAGQQVGHCCCQAAWVTLQGKYGQLNMSRVDTIQAI